MSIAAINLSLPKKKNNDLELNNLPKKKAVEALPKKKSNELNADVFQLSKKK